jgi:hypothetical protein
LVPPAGVSTDRPLSEWIQQWLLPPAETDENEQRERVRQAWAEMDTRQLFVCLKE